jgi:hypothetical protein
MIGTVIFLIGLLGAFGLFGSVLTALWMIAAAITNHYAVVLGIFVTAGIVLTAIRFGMVRLAISSSILLGVGYFWHGVVSLNWFPFLDIEPFFVVVLLLGATLMAICMSQKMGDARTLAFFVFLPLFQIATMLVSLVSIAAIHDYKVRNHYDLSTPGYQQIVR